MNLLCRLFLIMLFGINYSLAEKSWILPGLDVHSGVSEKVQNFLNSQSNMVSIKKTSYRYDVLGRTEMFPIKKMTTIVQSKPKMDVDVIFLDFSDYDDVPVVARYEKMKKEKKFSLNGLNVDEKTFFSNVTQIRSTKNSAGYSASLTAEEIEKILQGDKRVYIKEQSSYREEAVYSNILDSSGISTYAHSNGFKGEGISVGFADLGCPKISLINTSNFIPHRNCIGYASVHATMLTRIFQETAPNAILHEFTISDLLDTVNTYSDIVFCSVSSDLEKNYMLDDMRLDNFIYEKGVIGVAASGNRKSSSESYYVATPGKSLNAITVGSVIPFTNNYRSSSRWKNSVIENQKPEIANYDFFSFPDDTNFADDMGEMYTGTGYGTSYATAYTAGLLADVVQPDSFFKGHPEAAKALLISGSLKPINNFQIDADNHTQTAKTFPVFNNLHWGTRSAYWNGSNSNFFVGDSISFIESEIVAGKRYRIAISWLMPGTYIFFNKNVSQDLDLYVYQNGICIASSTSYRNPFEVVDFVAPTNDDLRIKIHRAANSGVGDVKLGYNMWIE